ncbi:hypothetical protein AC579_1914 [Pseudocercospora musae]|uniref:Uncharacterized protein n=1 Tax=Pseudocercospora musae TaxID=113226 RepID=A0A139HFF1_9PEZI|nr:hypothetical protein AC579_1914 [Pseudocercospora musae]
MACYVTAIPIAPEKHVNSGERDRGQRGRDRGRDRRWTPNGRTVTPTLAHNWGGKEGIAGCGIETAREAIAEAEGGNDNGHRSCSRQSTRAAEASQVTDSQYS